MNGHVTWKIRIIKLFDLMWIRGIVGFAMRLWDKFDVKLVWVNKVCITIIREIFAGLYYVEKVLCVRLMRNNRYIESPACWNPTYKGIIVLRVKRSDIWHWSLKILNLYFLAKIERNRMKGINRVSYFNSLFWTQNRIKKFSYKNFEVAIVFSL